MNKMLANNIKLQIEQENKKLKQSHNNTSSTQLQIMTKLLKKNCEEFEQILSQFNQDVQNKQIRQIKILDIDHKLSDSQIQEIVNNSDHANEIIQSQFLMNDVSDEFLERINNLEERYASMKNIGKEIENLQNMVIELNTLIGQQQETIDSIVTHVDKAQDNVVSGTSNLDKALSYQKCARKANFWMCIVCFIAILVIIFVLYAEGLFTKN